MVAERLMAVGSHSLIALADCKKSDLASVDGFIPRVRFPARWKELSRANMPLFLPSLFLFSLPLFLIYIYIYLFITNL